MEAPKAQTVRVGSTVSFICTARSKVASSSPREPPAASSRLFDSAVAGIHPGVDPDGRREAAQPGHGLQRHPDHSERAARGRGRVRVHGLQHVSHGRGHRHPPCARLVIRGCVLDPHPAPPRPALPRPSGACLPRLLPSCTADARLTAFSACRSNPQKPARRRLASAQRCSDRRRRPSRWFPIGDHTFQSISDQIKPQR